MRLRRASVITALSLLAWAATAYAECAWVLWSEAIERGSKPGLSIHRAFAAQQDCETEARSFYRNNGRPDLSPGVFITAPLNSQLQVRFMCLPDTVDPRGPKGK